MEYYINKKIIYIYCQIAWLLAHAGSMHVVVVVGGGMNPSRES